MFKPDHGGIQVLRFSTSYHGSCLYRAAVDQNIYNKQVSSLWRGGTHPMGISGAISCVEGFLKYAWWERIVLLKKYIFDQQQP